MSEFSRKQRKKTNDRITIEALSYYVPFFKAGQIAEEKILEGNLSPEDRNFYESQVRLKELTIKKIASLAGPLITSEINKIISTSHIAYSDDLFDLLYYAGMVGMAKGLNKFDEDKMKASATNYLFQWITVYAKRELAVIEAPFGIAPSRFQKYKKISAVRKKFAQELDREPTNEEVFEYFQAGRADIKTMNGKVSKETNANSNKNIPLSLIIEQDEFEKKYMNVALFDPQADYSSEIKLSKPPEEPFSQTVFGVFADSHNVSKEAKAVLLSEMGSNQISDNDSQVVSQMDVKDYQKLASAWKNVIKDPYGPFYEFLKSVRADSFSQFDIESTIKLIELSGKKNTQTNYSILFQNK
jgi:hypothetical protein